MSVSSPGQRPALWSASVPPQDLPLELFLRNGTRSVPVALVPTTGGFIRMKNPKTIQTELRAITPHSLLITEVRQFGRGGILCCSPDKACIQDLLKCTTFASHPVSSFIPPHLACCKGLVRGVDASLSPAEVLDIFSPAGVISVYRCTKQENQQKVPTETVIATFAGTDRPSEIKAWPLIYKVEALAPRPLQCAKCWRFGHSTKGCRSETRCRICGAIYGAGHSTAECQSDNKTCCLCKANHAADDPNCPARSKELQVIEIIERRRCSRREAIAEIQSRSQGYAGIAARPPLSMDASLSQSISAMVEKAVEKVLEKFLLNLSDSLNSIMDSQMSGASDRITKRIQPPSASISKPAEHQSDVSIDNEAMLSSPNTTEQEGISDSESIINRDVDMDARLLKRTRSPTSKLNNSSHPKTKKSVKEPRTKADFLKDSILDQAVATACLSS